MDKFYYYINYGSGFVQITPQNNRAKLALKREINPYIQRKNLSGSFMLIGTEAQAAFTYFITGANYEAPIRIYENGISGVGVLQYEGWTKVKSAYDFRRNQVTFESFRTDDAYTDLLAVYTTEFIGEDMATSGGFRRFAIQGQAANCNVLQAYTWTGTVWAITGNALTLPTDSGRVSATTNGTAVAVYDNVSKELRRYEYTAPNWALTAIGTSYFFPVLTGNGALVSYSGIHTAHVDDYYNQFSFLQAVAGTWTLLSQRVIENISLPSLAFMTNSNRFALVDNGTKVLRAYTITGVQTGETLSLGDIYKPQICTLDGINDRIALVDSKTFTLRCYTWSGTAWSELGSSIRLPVGYEICVEWVATNVVAVIDAIGGYLAKYTFSGTAWAKTGNTTTISNGYMAVAAEANTVIGVIQSDTYAFANSSTDSYRDLVNKILDLGLGLLPLQIPASGHGSTIDIDKLHVGDLSDINELSIIADPVNFYRYKASDLLKLLESFQQYWYIDGNNIKFTQPASFSGIGTNITVPSAIATELDQEAYSEEFETNTEIINFNNERGVEFRGEVINYGRNTQVEKVSALNITTDFNYIIDNFMGLDSNMRKSGLFLIFGENDVNGRFICESGTGIITSVDVKNNYLSKSKIQDTFWKDYRYANTGTIDINGSSSPVQDTVRPMIFRSNYQFGESDVALTQFPSSIGSVIYNADTYYITNLEIELQTWKYVVESVLLDL